jgi:hypothetical protein
LQDLLRRHAAGKHLKHMANRDSHPTNVGSPPHTSGLIVIRSISMRLFIVTRQ